MKGRRAFVIGSLLFATIYASIYGGTISYLLFFTALMIPVMAIGYLGYVYCSFKIFQRIETRTLIKGQEVPYYFTLSNESKMAFTSVAVSFVEEIQKVRDLKMEKEYCLLPGESEKKQTTLLANYRGEYEIGIDRVTIKDCFGIFSLTYTCRSKILAKVFPRIIKLDSLSFLSEEEDEKRDRMRESFSKEIPGTEVRKYGYGDDRKRIHWKLSACKDELMVKEYTRPAQVERILLLDMRREEGEPLHRMRCEDKLIECAIAVVNYMFQHEIAVKVIYETETVHIRNIDSQMEFDSFYDFCATAAFENKQTFERLLFLGQEMWQEAGTYIVLTCHLTKELCAKCCEAKASGSTITVIRVLEKETTPYHPEEIPVILVEPEDDLAEKLSHKGC